LNLFEEEKWYVKVVPPSRQTYIN